MKEVFTLTEDLVETMENFSRRNDIVELIHHLSELSGDLHSSLSGFRKAVEAIASGELGGSGTLEIDVRSAIKHAVDIHLCLRMIVHRGGPLVQQDVQGYAERSVASMGLAVPEDKCKFFVDQTREVN